MKIGNFKTVILLFILCFIYFLPGHNKYWHPYDEGFMLEAGCMINKGMVPYRDFFLLLYPPAQVYVIAFLFKIFGVYFMVARFYTMIVQTLICLLVFYIARRISSLKYAVLALIICLSIIPSYGRPIAIPTWPAIALSLLSILFFLDFIDKEKIRYLVYSGFFTGLTFMFRHDAGLWTTIPAATGILLFTISKEREPRRALAEIAVKSARLFFVYASFSIVFISALGVWLYKNGALGDAMKALFVFPVEYVTKAAILFPKFCFNPLMIFHRGSLFIKNNQYYVPILVCAASALLIALDAFSRRRLDKKTISLTVILLLGILYLQQVVIRADVPHLASAFPPSAILFAAMFSLSAEGRLAKLTKFIAISLVSLFMALLVYLSTESYIKETYIKAFIKKEIEPVAFDKGTLYVPDDGRDTIVSLVDYVKKHTREDEKIYSGNMDHSVNEFNQYHVLYFLTGRFPAVKYYELSAGLQSRYDVQEEMIESLKKNKTKMLILRSYGDDSPSLGPLDKFIRKNYRQEKIIDSCYIYINRQQ